MRACQRLAKRALGARLFRGRIFRTMVQKLDRLVTLFGGGGFIGRYVAQALYRTGVRVRVAQRNPGQAFFLKPLGGLGQTQFVACDITKPDQVAAAIRGRSEEHTSELQSLLRISSAVFRWKK